MVNNEEHARAEAEKNVRVALKHAGYGYDELYDELTEAGYRVELHADSQSFAVEVSALIELAGGKTSVDSFAVARMSRYTVRALDRAARQVRAQLQIEEYLEPWAG